MQIMQKRLEAELAETNMPSKRERKEDMDGFMRALNEKKQRKWLVQRGKAHLLEFTDKEIKKLHDCFMSLDDDASGSIGIDELEEPLIGLGIANTREEVEEMVMAVDDDGSGMIEFEEFLGIIANKGGGTEETKITQFFKDLSNGKLGDESMSFQMIVQDIRRRALLEFFVGNDQIKKEEGQLILENIKKMREREEEENSDDD